MAGSGREDRGLISLEGNSVRFALPSGDGWELPLDEVRLIGEYTTRDGPLADDWFIVFVTGGGTGEQWREAPFYAYGFETFLRMLRAAIPRLGHPMLAASADFASRVLYPMELDGRPLFDFVIPESRGIIGRIRSALAGSVRRELAPEVVEWLGRGRAL